MKIDIVIVTLNNETTISSCLDSIHASSPNKINIFVVDNASTDNTLDVVRRRFPYVRIIKNEENLGFAKANNQALRQSREEFVLLLNPDTEVVGDALDKMVLYLRKRKNVGVLGPKLLNADGSLQKELSSFPNLLSMILILLKLHRTTPFKSLVYPNYNYNEIQEVDHLMGSALLLRKEVFKKIGLFDENFFLWFEETDFEKKAKEAGFKIVYFPKASVKHLVGHSIKQINSLKRQMIWNKSLQYYFHKHKSKFEQIVLVPFIGLSYLPAFLIFMKGRLINK
jgi:GT2 family glycosyltransferase